MAPFGHAWGVPFSCRAPAGKKQKHESGQVSVEDSERSAVWTRRVKKIAERLKNLPAPTAS